jgi:hypothetical protein
MNTFRQENRSGTALQIYTPHLRDGLSHWVGKSWVMIAEAKAECPLEQTEHISSETLICEPAKDAYNLPRKNSGANAVDCLHAKKVAMYERAALLEQLLVTWVLFANDKYARIYERRNLTQGRLSEASERHPCFDNRSLYELVPMPDGAIAAESIVDSPADRDWTNAVSGGNDSARGIYDPCGDLKEKLKRKFIETIAWKLQQGCAKNSFDRLVLAAPSRLIAALTGQLNADVRNCIVDALPKDFAHGESDIAPRFY